MSAKKLSPEEAEKLWTQAKELRNKISKLKFLEHRDRRKAIDLAKRLIKEGPVSSHLLSILNNFIADVYNLDLKEYDASIDYYLESLTHDPLDVHTNEMLGLVYLRHKKDYKGAARVLQQALNHCTSTSRRIFIERELAEAMIGLKGITDG
jgi:tetratricopeptide (TPR) repeat protein